MDRKPVSVKSYANIAIVKYWGKDSFNQQHFTDFGEYVYGNQVVFSA